MHVAITYADGYPTTRGETIQFIVQRLEGIAESSSVTFSFSDCDECPVYFEESRKKK